MPNAESISKLLSEKREEAWNRVQDETEQVRRIDHLLNVMARSKSMPEIEVIKKVVPEFTVAAIRVDVPTNDQVPKLLGQAYSKLKQAMEKANIHATGPSLAIWYSTPDMHTDEVVDAAVPLARPVDLPGIEVTQIPETEVASALHAGPFSEFQRCHIALSEWMAANGYRLDGAYREIYHSCEKDNAVTEVQYPIVGVEATV